jgi:hypothetical protein
MLAAIVIPIFIYRRRQAMCETEEVFAVVKEVKELLVAQKERAAATSDGSENANLNRSLTVAWLPVNQVRAALFHDNPIRARRFASDNRRFARIWDKVNKIAFGILVMN